MSESQQKLNLCKTSSLLDELTSIYNEAINIKFTSSEINLVDALISPDTNLKANAAFKVLELGKKIKELIVEDSRFLGSNVRMINSNNGGCGFYPYFVGEPLIQRALETNSPEAAIEWLQKVLNTKAATGKTIQALWGITVQQEIQLTTDVKIVPIDDLPDSQNKQWLVGLSNYQTSNDPITTAFDYQSPKSALVMDNRIEPFTYDPEAQQNSNSEDFLKTNELLQEIILALTVVGPRVAISIAQWFTFDDPDLEASRIISGRMGCFLEIMPSLSDDYPILDSIESKKIVQAYIALPRNTKDKVRVALQRLNQALRRHNIGDRAVELSTAFEALLGDNGNTEMTHKIKVRSVRLLGGNEEKRKMNSAVIKEACSIRSKLVHTGHVNVNKTKTICGKLMTVSDIIDYTSIMCVDLIKIIILKGSIPDWEIFDITEHSFGIFKLIEYKSVYLTTHKQGS